MIKVGKVESRKDPLLLGRMKVRIVGVHTPDKSILPTDDLPWTLPIQAITSAAMNGIGESPTGAVEGTTVLVTFLDEDQQIPVALGTIGGIPTSLDVDIEPVEYVEVTNVTNDQFIDSSNDSGNIELNAAMDEAGITSPYQRAAIQAICNVESSNFTVLRENLNYKTVDRLLQVYPSAFKNDRTLAAQYINNPDGLAEFVYGRTSKTGKALGNTQAGDGRKYIGRGYVQITGRSNYNRIGKAIGVDLINNPELLETNSIAARASVAFFQQSVKTSGSDQNYYMAAKKAVGHNTEDISAKKDAMYAYYLGGTSQMPQTDKTITTAAAPADDDYGFQDPNNKYPLPDYLNEPDTNRLARGNYTGTIVTKKDNLRVTGVNIANSSATWNQPESAYNAVYPFNKVFESESGHVIERDDTPGNERTHDYHRMGTFREVDVNGTQVVRIVGDSYEIIDRNGHVSISGQYDLTVSGNANILTKGDANIQIYGDANVNVHGNASFKAAKVMDFSAPTMRFSSDTMQFKASNYSINTGKYSMTSSGDASLKYNGDLHTMIGANTYNRHNAGVDYSCPVDPPRSGDVDCGSVDTASATALSRIGGMTKNTRVFKTLTTPVRKPDEVFVFETPEDLVGATLPEVEALPSPTAKVEKPTQLKTVTQVAPSCDEIQKMDSFKDTMILHTDNTGYKWSLGKLLHGNALKEVTVRDRLYTKQDIVCNLQGLAKNVLGPLNETIGQVDYIWQISSLYRNSIPKGGSATSQHLYGAAVDISLGNTSYDMTYDLAKTISSSFVFDQLILEYLDRNGTRITWLHVGYLYGNNRNQIMTFLNHAKKAAGLQKLA